MKKVAVVIPYYHSDLSELESVSYTQDKKYFNVLFSNIIS